ncbi:hypothetical protein FAES_4030 [Fibrella aestuarina BUZ 2]|uniref:Helix-turn-helix domain-containing protein n=1 Tax=Fibrella aestuarina BUZ 2 TaxID=1166018 RepID=I0KD27_9BACT|nr:hypothetical protein [Fibrella aestuarina]CCH02030.1 hypothetical protein FAES_4030 [Fibrella aestuarina BUZ 2]
MTTSDQTVNHNDTYERFERESDASIQLAREAGLPVSTVNLDEWLTIKRYAERYGVTTHVVTNWIRRGTIPADCVLDLPELNDLRLVKNQAYK